MLGTKCRFIDKTIHYIEAFKQRNKTKDIDSQTKLKTARNLSFLKQQQEPRVEYCYLSP